MQHFVVLEIVHQRRRGRCRIVGEENRRSLNPHRLRPLEHLDQVQHRYRVPMRPSEQDCAAARPGPHQDEHRRAKRERHPAAVHDLVEVGDKETDVDDEKYAGERQRRPERPSPQLPDDEEGERGVDDHRAGDRDAVSVAERFGGAEQEHQREDSDQDDAVDAGNENLPLLGGGGVDDFKPRQQPELDRLAGQRKGAGDDGLAGDDCRRGRQKDERQRAPRSAPSDRRGSRPPSDW